MKVINGHVNVLVDDDGTVKTARELVDSLVKAGRLVAELEQRLAAAESIKQQLARFFHDAIELSFDGRDFDGGEMQERALGLWLIVETTPPDGEIGTWYEIAPGVCDASI
ncbi:MAG: hypothetical protein WAS33_18550 [Candidatus Promineifilaceae bacterium]